MKNFEYIFPVLTDAISRSFGGAIIGNSIGGFPVAILSAVIGAAILIFHGLKVHNQKKTQDKTSQ